MPPRADARSFLPLTAAVFHILLALADDDRHGYGIAREVAEATRGDVHLGPGTLYGTLVRMTKAGLVVEADPRPGDDRRRYFRLMPLGREVAKAEAHRLAELVGLARGKSLISRSRS
jgi:DNA-binding PadR family transcriptional regulator